MKRSSDGECGGSRFADAGESGGVNARLTVDYVPFDRLEIAVDGHRLVRGVRVPSCWTLEGPESGGEPLSFEQAFERLARLLGESPELERVAEVGRFERSKESLHSRWIAEAGSADPCASTPSEKTIQGITLSPGNYCSVGCAYCYAKPRFTGAPTDQTSETVLRDTFELIRSDPRVRAGCSITLGGGGDALENFAFYRRAVELSREYREEHGLEVPIYIATVDPRRLLEDEEILETILVNQDWITLSVDGDFRRAYNRPRVDFRPLLERHRGRCYWGASAVYTAKTVGHLRHNYHYLLGLDFDAIQFIPARLAPNHPLRLDEDGFASALEQYRQLVAELMEQGRLVELLSRLTTADYLGRFFFRYLVEKRADLRCGAGVATAFSDPLGRLYPCPSSSHPSVQMGDLRSGLDPGSLPVLQELESKPEECLRCPILAVCGGPCTHESLLLHEGPAQVTPAVCDFQRGLCEIALEAIRMIYSEHPEWLGRLFEGFVLQAAGKAPEEPERCEAGASP